MQTIDPASARSDAPAPSSTCSVPKAGECFTLSLIAAPHGDSLSTLAGRCASRGCFSGEDTWKSCAVPTGRPEPVDCGAQRSTSTSASTLSP
jgi:hypothetical protein